MTSNTDIVRKLSEVTDPDRVLADLEDRYVYSFGNPFEDSKYSNFKAVVRTVSRRGIGQIERLAQREGFSILHRGENADSHVPQERGGSILLDTVPPPKLIASDEKTKKATSQSGEYREKLMEAMRRERSYKGLASVIESIFRDRTVSKCKECKVCTGYCTVASAFKQIETFSAKGRYLLTRGLAKGEVEASERLADILYSCTLCGLCYAQCTPDLKLQEVILEARNRMVEEGLAPESSRAAASNIIKHGNPMGASAKLRTRWIGMLPEKFLREPANTLYWAGCNTVLRSGVRHTATATVEVLNSGGVDVMTLGGEEGCCGFSLVVGGFLEEAKRNAQQIMRAIDQAGVKRLVTSCSGCYETFKAFYPNRLGVEMPCQVFHSSEMVEDLMKESDIAFNKLPMRVSYHDPCGMGRHCGVYEPPREILRSIPELQVVEPDLSKEQSRCCGGGGGFWGVNSRASMNLAHLRIEEDIMPLKVEVLAVTCPLCHMNFLYAMRRHRTDIKVYDVMEIAEMALRKNGTSTAHNNK